MQNSDVNAAYFDGSKLYMVGATEDSDSTSFVFRLQVKNNQITGDQSVNRYLGGYAATSIIQSGKHVFITTGNSTDSGGGFYILTEKELLLNTYMPISDLRWVFENKDNLFLQSGSPSTVSLINKKAHQLESEFIYVGSVDDQSKSSFNINRNWIFIASGKKGVQIHNIKDGSHVATIPLPENATSDSHTNSVSVENDLIFISNGESVIVATYDKRNESDPKPEVIGRLDLGEHQSINQVNFRNNRLIIASGLGGTKLVKVQKK